MKTFKSKIDIWLFVVIFILIAVSLVVPFYLIFISAIPQNIVLAFFIFIVGAVLPFWFFITTKYLVTSNELIIKCGPFKWQIKIRDISTIHETNHVLGSPALSLDRLLIHYNNGRKIMISPKDKNAFIQALDRKDLGELFKESNLKEL